MVTSILLSSSNQHYIPLRSGKPKKIVFGVLVSSILINTMSSKVVLSCCLQICYSCCIPYILKIWQGFKLGSLTVCFQTAKLKCNLPMAILYRTAKFKSLQCAIWGSTAKFNSRQYCWLCSNFTSHINCCTQ